MRSKYGMVTKLFSVQRYDPRQVSESLVWCAKPHKEFSRPLKVRHFDRDLWTFILPGNPILKETIWSVPKIVFYAPNCVTWVDRENFLWGSTHQTKLSSTCLGPYLCAGKSFVTIPYLERILSHQTCKHSDFWIFMPLDNPVLKFEKAPKCVKNDGFEMKFSIEMSLKIFLCIQYHQYGYVKHCSSPGLYARKNIRPIGHSKLKILMKTLTPS